MTNGGGNSPEDLEAAQAKRNALAGRDLYGMLKRIRKLEAELERLKAAAGS